LITGCAGFIGYHLAKKALSEGYAVVGVDSLNAFSASALQLKIERRRNLASLPNFVFHDLDIRHSSILLRMLEAESFVAVIHLAALAGVRHSFSKPYLYLNYNICNFYNVLEACEKGFVKHLIYASSS